MSDKEEKPILTGYHRPFKEDETFREAMRNCVEAQKPIKRKITPAIKGELEKVARGKK